MTILIIFVKIMKFKMKLIMNWQLMKLLIYSGKIIKFNRIYKNKNLLIN